MRGGVRYDGEKKEDNTDKSIRSMITRAISALVSPSSYYTHIILYI